MLKKLIWLVLGIVVILSFYYVITTHSIPKSTYTKNRLFFWARELYIYYENSLAYPASLKDISQRGNFDYSINDGWGNVIEYTHDPNGLVCLKSIGADGSIGGDGEAKDINVSFVLNPAILKKGLFEFMTSIDSQMYNNGGKP